MLLPRRGGRVGPIDGGSTNRRRIGPVLGWVPRLFVQLKKVKTVEVRWVHVVVVLRRGVLLSVLTDPPRVPRFLPRVVCPAGHRPAPTVRSLGVLKLYLPTVLTRQLGWVGAPVHGLVVLLAFL